jgi:Ca-activated chloride channel family protein
MLLLQPGARAQGPTFRSSTELVNLNVTVVGQNLKPVDGLSQSQFEIYEDGKRQEVSFFAQGEMPLDVVILLDTSSSMTESMGLVQNAAVRFVGALRPSDRGTVMAISGGLRILQPLTADPAALTAAIRSTRPAGQTPLYASIYTALKELAKARVGSQPPRRQAIVVLSDGQDTSSGFSFDELQTYVRQQAVPIYPIAPRPSRALRDTREAIYGETTREQDWELRTMATDTGGRAFFPTALYELGDVYDEIARELSHQYSLGYQSTNSRLDGGFRRIAVRVAAPGVTWRTRAGYLAQSPAVGVVGVRSATEAWRAQQAAEPKLQ